MRKRQRLATAVQNLESTTYTGTQELLDSETGLIGYNSEIVRKFFTKMELEKRIKEEHGNLLEFGAGTGFLAEIFQSRFKIKPDCVELDPKLIKIIEDRGFVCFQFLHDTPRNYAAIYTSNVLEHIENDSVAFREIFNSLIPGGVVGIYVPAHPILYSTMDKEIGHVRRYTRSELREKVLDAGFTIQSLYYDDFIGFFASVVVKLVGYKSRAKLGSQKSLVFYDKVIYPVSRIFDSLGLKYLLGKNLILIATRPEN